MGPEKGLISPWAETVGPLEAQIGDTAAEERRRLGRRIVDQVAAEDIAAEAVES